MNKYLWILLIPLFLGCCKKKKDNPQPQTPAPAKSSLLAPAKDEVCLNATPVSANESAVLFKWSASDNTTAYDVTVKNLESGVTFTRSGNGSQLEITLDTNTPYSWYVTSKGPGGSTKSDLWKFYNAGKGKVYYAPFPAELKSPGYGAVITAASGAITLQWEGADADGDMKDYDVYLGTTNAPALLKANVADQNISGIDVEAGNTYHWYIISRDKRGNTSESEHYVFSVK
jgi:hypothetical protein